MEVFTPDSLPIRRGPRPRTTTSNPHMQLDQRPGELVIRALAARCFALPDVEERPSLVSVPGARAMWLLDNVPQGPRDAFLIGREFAHLHPLPDGSLHAALPGALAREAIAKGWAEPHPLGRFGIVPESVVMLYAPRNEDEVRIVSALIDASYRFAGGRPASPDG